MKALLLIDIQKGLTVRSLYHKDKFIQTVNKTILEFRKNNNLIVFVQHENKQLTVGTESWEIDNNLLQESTDAVFSKSKGDAFSNKDLVDFLMENKITDITVGGLVSHGCVKHTCLGGLKSGFNVSLLQDGHSNWAKDAKEKIEATEIILKKVGIKIIKI